MSPIHHHFEMSGWSEGKICVVFTFVQIIFCALAIFAATRL
jgi:phospho-N-acetylmuramoyl-pentapeptide-transferase